MNLIKLFNKEYLKENIKKSRGFIFLFLILVPLFTALVTILEINRPGVLQVPDKIEVTWVNLIGMYVIPLVLSFSLFGYVYKKNSVDFINSMPLNRKTIFVTNTIGGIILITIMQIITALILFICDIVLADVIIFTKMITDIFILMWVSYVFVFIATNLAMTFSGTFLTQIALTMLLLFLVPFCVDSYNEFSNTVEYKFINESSEFTNRFEEDRISYTMPYRLMNVSLGGENEDLYEISSIVRMIVLSILYFGIGMYLFQKRKMENTEESFANIKMHIFVKALTIFPMIIILNLIEPDIEFTVFVLALIIVYYFIFDFVIKRKVNLKVSIPSLILILLTTQGICMGAKFVKNELSLNIKSVNKNDVVAVSIGNCRNYSSGSWYYYRDMFDELGYYIENQEIIDIIFGSGHYVKQIYNSRTENSKEIAPIEVTVEEITEQKVIDIDEEEKHEQISTISVFLKLKSGKKLHTDIDILEKDFDRIIEILEKDDNFTIAVKEMFMHEGATAIENILCDEKTSELVKNEIKSKLDQMSVKEIYTTLRTSENCGFYQYYYENNKLMSNTVSITTTDKLFELGAKILNQKTIEVLKKAKQEDVYSHFYVEIPEERLEKKYTGYADFNEDEIFEFILNNEDKEFDPNKEYYLLRGNIGNYYTSVYFYTNNVEEINEMVRGKGIQEVIN